MAAQLLASSSLLEKLGPIGEWNVIEGLLKATIVPNLPTNILGELYNQLTVASWRQSKIEQADHYSKKAEELGHKSGDKSVLAGALLSKANIFSWRGKSKTAIQTYQECLKLESFIQPKTIGSTYSNLGAVLYESGDFDSGESYQKKAIDIFTFHGKPMNLSIAWCHLAMIYLQKDQLKLARQANEKSIIFATQDDYRRGFHIGNLIHGELASRGGNPDEARKKLSAGLNGFLKIGVEEGLNYEFAGRISRLVGDLSASEEYLRKGVALSNEFPIYQAALFLELSKTLATNSLKTTEAKDFANRAADLYRQCEAPIRVEMANNFLNSIA